MPELVGPDGVTPLRKRDLIGRVALPEVTGVRQIVSETASVGLTPSRLATLLKEAETPDPRRYLALAEEMEEKEPQYLTVLPTRKRAVTQLDITVEPAGDSADDAANAELVQQFVDRECLEAELFHVLDGLGKGFSATEIEWDMSEGQWRPRALHWVDPTWFEFDREDLRTLYLKSAEGPQPLAAFKWVQFFPQVKSGIPMRSGLARPAAWCYLFKNFGVKGWVTFAEVYGQPLRLGRYPPAATEDEIETLLRAVRLISQDAAAVVPTTMAIDFIQSQSTGQGSTVYESLARYMDAQLSKIVLGQTMTTDDGSSLSQAQVHNEVREDIERSDAKQLAAVLNGQLVRPLVALNRGPQKAYPRIRIGRAEQTDVAEFTRSVEAVVRLGAKVSKSHVMSRLGLETPKDDDDALGGPPPDGAGQPGGDQPPGDAAQLNAALMRLALNAAARRGDQIDGLVGQAATDEAAARQLAPMLAPLVAMMEGAEDLETIRNLLIDTIAEMDTTQLETFLAQSGFAAGLAGRLGADREGGDE